MQILVCASIQDHGSVFSLNPIFCTRKTKMSSNPSTGVLTCPEPGCENLTFSNKGNLERHVKSKHVAPEMAEMPCGKLIKKNNYNIERHMKRCGMCKAIQQGDLNSYEAGHVSGDPSTFGVTKAY
ncbi:hypothetical protein EsH8_IV_000455 [Colletotrichum jinshuiense]